MINTTCLVTWHHALGCYKLKRMSPRCLRKLKLSSSKSRNKKMNRTNLWSMMNLTNQTRKKE